MREGSCTTFLGMPNLTLKATEPASAARPLPERSPGLLASLLAGVSFICGTARVLPAFFAGCRLGILHAHARSETTFYNTLGISVVVLSALSGFGLAFVAAFRFQTSFDEVWWIVPIWATVMAFGIERLVLQLSGSRRSMLPFVIAPRLLLTVVIGVLIAEPLMLQINGGEIDRWIASEQIVAIANAKTEANRDFDAQITTDSAKVAELIGHEKKVAREAAAFDRNVQEGCRKLCAHWNSQAESRRADLAAMLAPGSRHDDVLKERRTAIAQAQKDKTAHIADQTRTITASDGLLSREDALSALQREHPSLKWQAWFWRILFGVLDLLPLTTKTLRMLSVNSSYDAHVKAEMAEETARAYERQQQVETVKVVAREQGMADRDLARHGISIETGRLMNEAEGVGGTPEEAHPYDRIDSFNLSDLAENAVPHERQPVDMTPELRRGGLIGLALMVALGLGVSVASALGVAIAGAWLVLPLLAVAVGLAVVTRGFRRSPRWTLRPTFGTLLAGLALPIVVLAINL